VAAAEEPVSGARGRVVTLALGLWLAGEPAAAF
jgi:hypothetical protein